MMELKVKPVIASYDNFQQLQKVRIFVKMI